MINLLRWDELTELDQSKVRGIFFETSSVNVFANDEAKEKFCYKYFGFYAKHFPHLFFIAKERDDILGYICGSPYTLGSTELFILQPHLEIFKDLYQKYPAHLHINLTSGARGKGIGGLLLNEFEDNLREQHIKGLHLITTKDSRNVHFYEKTGFLDCFERAQGEIGPLYLMAKVLNT